MPSSAVTFTLIVLAPTASDPTWKPPASASSSTSTLSSPSKKVIAARAWFFVTVTVTSSTAFPTDALYASVDDANGGVSVRFEGGLLPSWTFSPVSVASVDGVIGVTGPAAATVPRISILSFGDRVSPMSHSVVQTSEVQVLFPF